MLPKIRLIVAVAGLVMAIMIPSTFAADFPAKDITLICPWSAGGGTDTLARALVKNAKQHLGVNVNVVKAGLVETDSTRRIPFSDRMFAERENKSMVGTRELLPEDVANAVLFLASPLSDLVQGETLTIDGGSAIHV